MFPSRVLRQRLRAHYWKDVPEGPLLTSLRKATDASTVDLSVGAASLPSDTEVCVLPSNILPESLGALVALPALQAVVLPYAGLLPKHLHPLQSAFGPRLGSSVQLHNLHHNAAMTAEMAIALMLAAAKRLVPADRRLRSGDWRPRGIPYPLSGADDDDTGGREPALPMLGLDGQTALVLGLGGIGTRVAAVCAALGMRVLGTKRQALSSSHSGGGQGGNSSVGIEVHPPSELRALLPSANVLLVCLPHTAETAGLLGAAELALLPQDAVLVNVSRGAIVDEHALYEALASGRLHGAGLDVWWRYPASYAEASDTPPSRLHDYGALDTVVLSPHRGGGVGVPGLELTRMRHVGDMLTEAGRRGVARMPHRWDFNSGY
mmetsp:Transcript_58771/g.118042  ORF Transcript_58771/g.118042 Transcript_58771/m.118042 type:complete len:377 (+) Transcript_58771:140-1270(+)